MEKKSFEPLTGPMSSTSSEDLLEEKLQLEEEFLEDAGLLRQRRRAGCWKKTVLPILTHCVLIMIYTAVTLYLLHRNNESWKHGPNLIHSPARQAHEYERVTFDGFFTSTNPYKGEWRPELDEAWGTLLENSNIVVSKEDLDAINKTSVQVPDGSGYLATLDVHHQLHCIKQIRQYLHPEQYTMDEPNIVVHIDHCLDDLRMMMMCKADISLLTYEWIPHYHKPFPVWDVTHECTNWEKLDAWAGERSLDMSNIPVHPELMGGWVDPETMSADARYFLQQVRDYEAKKQKAKEDEMRAHILGDQKTEEK